MCNITGIKHVTQVAYFSESSWLRLLFDRKNEDIPKEVIEHFRDINNVKLLGKKVGITIDIVKSEFSNSGREAYTKSICRRIQKQSKQQIVFLDPDNGLAPKIVKAEHVTCEDISLMWQCLKGGDYLVLYQHSPHIPNWRNARRREVAKACSIKESKMKMWKALEKINDVAFFFCEK